MNKKILMIPTLILTFILLASITTAQFSGEGEGTQSSPYIITNPQQLDEVRNNLTAYYILENDIDLNVSPYNENFGWNPIGTSSQPFKGNFDGKGYTIYNLFHNSTAIGVGLFGFAESCISISNFSMKNVYIKSFSYTGSVVGALGVDCLLTNVNAHGEIEGEAVLGGLVGEHTMGGETISNSYANVSIKGDNMGGGLVGVNEGLIENSYSKGYVDVNTNSGGLIGLNADTIDDIVINSFYDTNTSGQSDTGKGTPKTTNEMQDINTFSGWDIALKENFDGETWFIDQNNDYPRLFYEYEETGIFFDNETYNYTNEYVSVYFTPITGTILEGDILSGNNWVYVNPQSPANVPATIQFNYSDVNNNSYPTRNGVLCSPEYCDNILIENNVLTFDVTSFSNYSYMNYTVEEYNRLVQRGTITIPEGENNVSVMIEPVPINKTFHTQTSRSASFSATSQNEMIIRGYLTDSNTDGYYDSLVFERTESEFPVIISYEVITNENFYVQQILLENISTLGGINISIEPVNLNSSFIIHNLRFLNYSEEGGSLFEPLHPFNYFYNQETVILKNIMEHPWVEGMKQDTTIYVVDWEGAKVKHYFIEVEDFDIFQQQTVNFEIEKIDLESTTFFYSYIIGAISSPARRSMINLELLNESWISFHRHVGGAEINVSLFIIEHPYQLKSRYGNLLVGGFSGSEEYDLRENISRAFLNNVYYRYNAMGTIGDGTNEYRYVIHNKYINETHVSAEKVTSLNSIITSFVVGEFINTIEGIINISDSQLEVFEDDILIVPNYILGDYDFASYELEILMPNNDLLYSTNDVNEITHLTPEELTQLGEYKINAVFTDEGNYSDTKIATFEVIYTKSPFIVSLEQTGRTFNQTSIVRIRVDDLIRLEPNGYIIFSLNKNGTWINKTQENFTMTPQTKAFTFTNPENGSVEYKFYIFNDFGYMYESQIYSYNVRGSESPFIFIIQFVMILGLIIFAFKLFFEKKENMTLTSILVYALSFVIAIMIIIMAIPIIFGG